MHRKTKSVQTMLDFFKQRNDAVNAVDLVELFKEKMNKATVYRIISRLESEGIIHSFKGADGLTWYASCKECTCHEHYDCHPHFQCKVCGKMECLEVVVKVPKIKRHKVDSEIILLVGECENCIN